MKKPVTLIFISASVFVFVIQYAYLLLNKDTLEYPMFPYDPTQLISKAAYLNSLCLYFSILFLFSLMGWLLNIPRYYIMWVSAIWIGFIIDFVLTYNNPLKFYYTHGWSIPISYSLLGGLFLVAMAGYELYKFIKFRRHGRW